MSNKRGYFLLSRSIAQDSEMMAFLRNNFSVYDQIPDLNSCIRLYCESDHFEDVGEGQLIPQYDLTVQRKGDGVLEILKVELYA